MKRLLFGITSLKAGGAERVLIDVVNKLKDDYDITIFMLYGQGEFTSQLDSKIKKLYFTEKSYQELPSFEKRKLSLTFLSPYLKKRFVKKYIQGSYDVAIAFLEGPITWLFEELPCKKKIAWVHNDITQVFGTSSSAKTKRNMSQKAYRNYQEIIFVSKDNLVKFESFDRENQVPKKVIYNYIDQQKVRKKATLKEAREIKDDLPSFVVVSRLTNQKAIPRLVNVHQRLLKDGYRHRIYVVGEGEQRPQIESLIKAYACEDTFVLLGNQENPYPYIKQGDYFLLASYYEGYPMVLLEALILKKAIIITDTAAREVVENREHCLVVTNDEEGIYRGMKQFLSKSVPKEVTHSYQNEAIICDIIKLLEE